MKDKTYKIFSEVFETPISEINDSLNKDNFDKWDSIFHLTLVSELETEFEISLEPEDIEKMVSMELVLSVLQSKLGQAA